MLVTKFQCCHLSGRKIQNQNSTDFRNNFESNGNSKMSETRNLVGNGPMIWVSGFAVENFATKMVKTVPAS